MTAHVAVSTEKRRSLCRLPPLLSLLALACSPSAPTTPAEEAALLGPAGGELAFLDGTVRIRAEPGALVSTTRFTAAPSTGHPGSARLVPGTALRIHAEPPTTVPLHLSMEVSAGSLPATVRLEELGLYALGGGFWRGVTGSTVTAGGTVTAPLPLPATVAVLGAAPTTVEVLPAQVRMAPGEQRTLTAVVRDAAGAELPLRPVLWSTSKATVAVVDAHGVVTAVAPGIAHIGATAEQASGSNSVVVEAGG